MTTDRVKAGKPDARGYAIVKDRCAGCGRVIYGYMPMNVPVPEPRCSGCTKEPADG